MAEITGRTGPAPVRAVCVFGSPWPGGLGDSVLFNIFLALFRRAFPQAKITYVVGAGHTGELLSGGHSYADEVITCPGDYDEDPQWWRQLIARMGAAGCDCCVLDPVSEGPIAEIAAEQGIATRIGVVTGGPEDQFLTVRVHVAPPGEHDGSDLLDYAQALASALGLPVPGPAEALPAFRYRPESVPQLPRPVIAVHPGGAPEWNRRWPLARFGDLCRELAVAERASFVLVGTADERPDLARLRDEITAGVPGTQVTISAGESINHLAALLDDADVMVGNDSAPAHIAAALRTATVVLYGPSPNEFWWRRLYPQQTAVTYHHVCENDEQAFGSDTAPCQFACPYPYAGADGPYPRCMTEIGVAEVCRAVRGRLPVRDQPG
jgi:ADP-heptose:LPS heptosyltransferase